MPGMARREWRKWRGNARKRFLEALAKTGNVTRACEQANLGRARAYALREQDETFAAAWTEAEEIAVDALEAEARRRAIEGVQRPLVSAGKVVKDDNGEPIILREYSDTLLIALLRAHRPRKFNTARTLVELTGKDGDPISLEQLVLGSMKTIEGDATMEAPRLPARRP